MLHRASEGSCEHSNESLSSIHSRKFTE